MSTGSGTFSALNCKPKGFGHGLTEIILHTRSLSRAAGTRPVPPCSATLQPGKSTHLLGPGCAAAWLCPPRAAPLAREPRATCSTPRTPVAHGTPHAPHGPGGAQHSAAAPRRESPDPREVRVCPQPREGSFHSARDTTCPSPKARSCFPAPACTENTSPAGTRGLRALHSVRSRLLAPGELEERFRHWLSPSNPPKSPPLQLTGGPTFFWNSSTMPALATAAL